MIRNCLAAILLLCTFGALAAKPSAADIAACQNGKSQGGTTATEIPFQILTEEDDYWRGYTAITVEFKGKSIGRAKKGDDQGIAYNRRVYPISQAQLLNMSRAEFDDQVEHGSIGIDQASDWYWLKGRQQFVCIATNRSMEKAAPILFFLSTGKDKHVYVVVGKERKADR